MAYGLLLYKQIDTPAGTQRLEIYKDGYAGSAVEIVGLQRDGLSISKDSDNLAQAVTTSVLTIRLNDCGEVDYSQLFTPNSTLFKVIWKTKVSSSWETRWTGFITPDSFKENLSYRDMLTLTARDNLGRMGDYDFSLPKGQMLSVRDIVNAGLAVAGVAMTTTWTTTKVATSPATVLVVDGLVNTSLLQGMTWREAVELLLAGLGLTLAWNDGNHFEVRDISQAPAASQTAFFVNNSGFRQIRPAWKNLTISQSYGLRDSFYEGQFTKDDCGGAGRTHKTFTPPSGSKWSKTGSVALMNPYNGTQAPYETLFMPLGGEDTITDALVYTQNVPAMDRTITIAMKLNNTLWYTYETVRRFGIAFNGATHQSTAHLDGYTVAFRFNVFLTYGNTKYVLRENWEVYDPSDTEDPYLYFNMPWTRDGVNQFVDASISIDSIPENGVLEFVVYKPLMYLFNGTKENSQPITPQTGYDWYGRINEITMSIGESVTGRSNLISINAAHNVQETLDVVVGQVPPGRGGFLLYYGGLFYDDTVRTVLSGFKRSSSEATTYSLLELVAREHISYNNDNYDLLSGDMMTSGTAFRFDKLISYGSADMRIIGASLNILENIMNATALQTEAEFTTDAYSITEIDSEGDYSSSGSSYSGGAAQGGGSQGDQFFAAVKDPTTSETVGAKALYDLLIIQEEADEDEGTPEITKNITQLLRHFSVGDNDGTPYVICDIALGSAGQTFSGGYAPGGGGTGGSIATLVDVTLTSLSDKQILTYDAASSHWVNRTPALSTLTDVSTDAPQHGQALIYNSATGLWTPQTIQTSGGALSSLTDVALTSLSNGDVLVYDSATRKWKNASDYATQTWVTDKGYATETWVTNKGYLTSSALNGYATQTWVTNKGYATETWVTNKGYITSSALSGYATQTWVTNKGYITSSALNGYATETWVTNKGYITSSALSGYATQTWVQNQNYLTSTDLSGYATQTWVTNKGYATMAAVEAWAEDEGFATETWVTNKGYMPSSNFTASNIVSTLGTTAVNRATADADGNTISSTYLKLTGGTLTGDLRLKSGNYGLTLYFGDNSYAYIQEDTDDHLTVYGRKGVSLLTTSTSYAVEIGSSSVATPATIYGNATTYGNLTVGDSSSTSACKTLTVYGRTSSSYPALTIYGVANSSTRYATNIYRDATYLQIGSSVYISGNLVITGNSTSGQASDRRLKEDIKPININEASDLLSQLRPVEFSWNKKAAELGQLSGRSRGFIADEYLKLIPEAGRKIWGDYDAIDYIQAIPYIVAAWQQQNLKIRILEDEISSLKAENELMKRRERDGAR